MDISIVKIMFKRIFYCLVDFSVIASNNHVFVNRYSSISINEKKQPIIIFNDYNILKKKYNNI